MIPSIYVRCKPIHCTTTQKVQQQEYTTALSYMTIEKKGAPSLSRLGLPFNFYCGLTAEVWFKIALMTGSQSQ